jgi:hypothetical protein
MSGLKAQERIALTAAVLVARLLGTRDLEVVMVSVTGLVVMVSVTGSDGVSVPVSIIETWRFPSLGFCFLVLTEPPPTGTVISKSAFYPTATE